MYVRRDPIARGEYVRTCFVPMLSHHVCAWCGNRPKRLFIYRWRPDGYPFAHVSVRDDRYFCNLKCFDSYYF